MIEDSLENIGHCLLIMVCVRTDHRNEGTLKYPNHFWIYTDNFIISHWDKSLEHEHWNKNTRLKKNLVQKFGRVAKNKLGCKLLFFTIF